eukprot:CAMPEP_0197076712 /NCGR_PEP_ID=MMETSP1384-20130603/212255_1 /TAXON_ID=29189 /ORGANISM="Ammonia sp." /LENGTH=147 /DNA_ID=CAMNT_0042515571 /DNA_START=451 /DNA_END=894 /DNA_ORIENTATION=+
MSWQQYVQAAQGLGFTKVTIINRSNYQTVGYTSAADIATAWKDGDQDINENQELLDDWTDKKKTSFCFYATKFNIILRDDEEGTFVVCMKGQEVCVARQFKTIWFIAYGKSKKKGKANKDEKGFASAADAFNKISKDIWDGLDEAGV